MALKGPRHEFYTDISFYMNEVATRGRIVVHDTAQTGVGAAMDDPDARVKLPDVIGGSGEKPAGLLLCDVVNYDLTRQPLNEHKDEVQLGGKVVLLKRGWVVTNMISGSDPQAGDPAYFGVDGYLTDAQTEGGDRIGTWMSGRDSDGYAKVDIDIN